MKSNFIVHLCIVIRLGKKTYKQENIFSIIYKIESNSKRCNKVYYKNEENKRKCALLF